MTSNIDLARALDPDLTFPGDLVHYFTHSSRSFGQYEVTRSGAPVAAGRMCSRRSRILQVVLGFGATHLDFVDTSSLPWCIVEQPIPLRTIPMHVWNDRYGFMRTLEQSTFRTRIQTLGVMRWVQRTRPSLLGSWLTCWSLLHESQDPFSFSSTARVDQQNSLLSFPSNDSVQRLQWRERLKDWRKIIGTQSWLHKEQFYLLKAEQFQTAGQPDAFIKIFRDHSDHYSGIAVLGFQAPTFDELVSLLLKEQAEVVSLLQDDPVKMSWATFIKAWSSTSEMRENPRAVLEFEATSAIDLSIAAAIRPPRFVSHYDWWSRHSDRSSGLRYIQFAEAGFFSLFHIDYLGTSQYFHVVKGAKHLFMLEPTPANIAKIRTLDNYATHPRDAPLNADDKSFDWVMQQHVHLVRLVEGQTIIIPGGWIHAVYTPVNTVVISGNFLHDSSLPEQIACWENNVRDDPENTELAVVIGLASRAAETLAASQRAGHNVPASSHLKLLLDFLAAVSVNAIWDKVRLSLTTKDRKQMIRGIQALKSLDL